MFKVVWKSFKYNRKNFLSFFMSEILSVAVIFMLIYIQEALSQVPGIKTEALQFAYQSELRKQLRIIIPCIILIMILVTGYSVKAYINTRIWDYKLFQLLGIRKKNLKVMIGLEYVISGMLACGFGILFGLIGTKIIKEILHTRINARFVKGISMSRVYLVLILSCLIMTIGYLSVVKEISRDMWWSLLLAIGISGMFCGVFIKSYYYGTMEIVLIQKEVAMLGWILCIYGIIFMIFIIFSTRRLWKEISKIWGDKN